MSTQTGRSLDEHERSVLEDVPRGLHIDGQWREASGGGTLAVEDPSTGEALVEVADATPEDALAALAAGCTIVVKPAQQTPLSMLALAGILQRAGLPTGVLNVITAKRSGAVIEPLLRDPRTRKLSFTGSTEVGRRLIEQSAEQVLRVSMELGGNAPFLVFEDADLDAAVDGAMLAKLRNVGEACTAANRFHVHESIAEEFARRVAERMRSLRVGRGTDSRTDVGPPLDENQGTKAAGPAADAADRGARVLLGGEQLDGRGYFYAP